MASELSKMILDIGGELFDSSEEFAPIESWSDLGRLLEAMEVRGCYLMTNSVNDSRLRRTASFHKSTARGYPCIGSSEWGEFETLGEAVVRAAHECLMAPRA